MKVGRVTENAEKRSILRQIKTRRDEVIVGAGLGEDCAIFSFENEGCVPACQEQNGRSVVLSCVQEGVFPVAYLLQRCANILASRGGKPIAAAMSILLPPEAEEAVLQSIMAEAEETCSRLGMEIARAQGTVTGAVNEPFVTVTAYGAAAAVTEHDKSAAIRTEHDPAGAAYHTVKAARPGQDIVLSKWIGLEGTAILAKRWGGSLRERYPAWLPETAAGFDRYLSTVPEAAVAVQSNACVLHNVSEGGIMAALWELAEGADVGLTIDLKKLPVRQETVEICNHCNISPYELLSGGCLLMTGADGPGLVRAMEAADIPAVIVGKVTDSRDRLILNEDEVRYLDRPHADSIYQTINQEAPAAAGDKEV